MNAFGIEISDSSIKVLQFKKRSKYYRLIGYKITPLPTGLVVAGEIINPSAVSYHISKTVSEARPKKISTAHAVCSLPENKTFIRILNIPKMSKEELEEGIKWKAEQYIPLPIDTIYLDWQIIEETNNQLKILIAAAPKTFVDKYINTLKRSKLKPVVMDLEEAAEARALIPIDEQEQASLIVDIGATKTVFVVKDKKTVPFASNTSEICGNKFTQAIVQELKIKPEQAEQKKIACCSPKLTEEEKRILRSMSPLFDILTNEIIKIINYYRRHFPKSNEISKIILCGGAAALSSIVPNLTLKIKKKIIIGNPLVNIPLKKPLPINKFDLLRLTTVVGLAIRGASLLEYQRKI